MRRTAALIVGGGPAGSAVAITLARAGVRPELMERSRGDRDVVCGGFLGWDALAGLKRIGIDPAGLGARPIHGLRLISGDRMVETALPKPAAGLSRRRLDSNLLELAEQAGTAVRRGTSVRALDDRGIARLDDGEEIAADGLFLATGKHELRGAARSLATRREPPAVGLRAGVPVRADLERDLAGMIELHLFDEGYAGLLLQEDGFANFCLSVSRSRLSAAGEPGALVAQLVAENPQMGARLGNVPQNWEAVAGVPYGWRASETTPGLFRVGDQAAVIASLAGDGIAIALASGCAAAKAFLSGGPGAAEPYQRRFSRRSARPVAIGEVFRGMAERPFTRGLMMNVVALAPAIARSGARLTRID